MKWIRKSWLELAAIAVGRCGGGDPRGAAIPVGRSDIGRVEQNRLKSELGTSVREFDQEFSYDFERLTESFPEDTEAPAAALESRAAQQYANWLRTAAHPGLIAAVDIWKTAYSQDSYFESLDASSRAL